MNEIIGEWRGNKEILIFGENKYFKIDQYEGKWFTRGQYLTLDVKSSHFHNKVKRKFKIDKYLFIEGQDGEFIRYKKKK
jgi:hypothetical protein